MNSHVTSYGLAVILDNDISVCCPYQDNNGRFTIENVNAIRIPSVLTFTNKEISIGNVIMEESEKEQVDYVCGFIRAFQGSVSSTLASEIRKKCSCTVDIDNDGNVDYIIQSLNNQHFSPSFLLQLYLQFVVKHEEARIASSFHEIIIIYPPSFSNIHVEYLNHLLQCFSRYSIYCLNRLTCEICAFLPSPITEFVDTKKVFLFHSNFSAFHIYACEVSKTKISIVKHIVCTAFSKHSIINHMRDLVIRQCNSSMSEPLPKSSYRNIYSACNSILEKLSLQSIASIIVYENDNRFVCRMTDFIVNTLMDPVKKLLTQDIEQIIQELQWSKEEISSLILSGDCYNVICYKDWLHDVFPSTITICANDITEIFINGIHPTILLEAEEYQVNSSYQITQSTTICSPLSEGTLQSLLQDSSSTTQTLIPKEPISLLPPQEEPVFSFPIESFSQEMKYIYQPVTVVKNETSDNTTVDSIELDVMKENTSIHIKKKPVIQSDYSLRSRTRNQREQESMSIESIDNQLDSDVFDSECEDLAYIQQMEKAEKQNQASSKPKSKKVKEEVVTKPTQIKSKRLASKSVQSNPVESKSVESSPSQSKSTQSKPTQSKPSQSKPTQSKPTQSKPTQSKPTQSKPTQSKPTQSKPTQSKPTQSTKPEPIQPESPASIEESSDHSPEETKKKRRSQVDRLQEEAATVVEDLIIDLKPRQASIKALQVTKEQFQSQKRKRVKKLENPPPLKKEEKEITPHKDVKKGKKIEATGKQALPPIPISNLQPNLPILHVHFMNLSKYRLTILKMLQSTRKRFNDNLCSELYSNESLNAMIPPNASLPYRYKDGSEYSGGIQNGMRHGKGSLKYRDGTVYRGTFKENMRNGHGVVMHNDYRIFEGTFIKDIPKKGILRMNSNGCYEGGFDEKGIPSGKGTYYSNGHDATWDGGWKDGKPNGEGTYFYDSGDYFIGTLLNGKRDGKGSIYDKKGNILLEVNYKNDLEDGEGSIYRSGDLLMKAHFANGLIEGSATAYGLNENEVGSGMFKKCSYWGKGLFYFDQHTWYKGQIANNQFVGDGEYHFNDDLYMTGRFTNNNLNGKIKLYSKQKLLYEGPYSPEGFSGEGCEYYPDGRIMYEGNFSKGLRNGKGTLHFENGSYYVGCFKFGYISGKGSVYDKDGNLLFSAVFFKDQVNMDKTV